MKRNIIGKFAAAIMAAGIMACQALSVFADGDVQLDCKNAVESENWTQSVKFNYDNNDPNGTLGFDATRITEDTVFTVEYDVLEEHIPEDAATGYPMEMIFQSWTNPDTPNVTADGAVWARVAPASIDTDKNIETFNYADIVAAYGSDNFEKVDCVLFGSTNDAKIKVKAVTVSACKDKGSHWVDPSIAEKEKAAAKKNIIGIVVGIAAGIAVAVGVIWFIISSKSREAFDITTGEFVDKKDAI